jgi:hypothetical protein
MEPIEHLKSHITKDYLERLSNIALATSGFSAGILVLLLQSEGTQLFNEFTLWSAIVALLLSLFGWQYMLPYILHGESTYKHININLVALLEILIVVALFAGITALVWQSYKCAGVALAVGGIALGISVLIHNIRVTKFCEKSITNKGIN